MEKWNELCFILSEKIPSNTTEQVFEQKVIQAFEKLGWSEFHGDLVIRKSINIGAANKITPDILVKSEYKNLFVIEVKKPNLPFKHRINDQISSYLRQLKLEFGIIIGEKIQLIYDGKLSENNETYIFEEIHFVRDNPKGKEFIRLFSKENFSAASLENYVQDKLIEIENLKISEGLKNELTSVEYISKLKDLMKSELQSNYSENVIEKVLSEINIRISDKLTSSQTEILAKQTYSIIEKPKRINLMDNQFENKLAIGKYVNSTFREIVNAIDKEEVERLLNKNYSKVTFHIDFPFLLKNKGNLPFEIIRRYYRVPVLILGESYFFCSQWYEKPTNNDRPYYESWLRKMKKK